MSITIEKNSLIKYILMLALVITLSSFGLTQKLLCQVSMEPDEYNTAFSRNKCDAVVNDNARHWYLDRR